MDKCVLHISSGGCCQVHAGSTFPIDALTQEQKSSFAEEVLRKCHRIYLRLQDRFVLQPYTPK